MHDDAKKEFKKELVIIVLFVFVAVLVIIGLFVDFIECPVCEGTPILHYLCPSCGRDGKMTLFHYIMWILTHL